MAREKLPELTIDDLRYGAAYRGKRFVENGWGRNNDRVIVWIGSTARFPGELAVQYDSDTVRDGQSYPYMTAAKFLKWAKYLAPAPAETEE